MPPHPSPFFAQLAEAVNLGSPIRGLLAQPDDDGERLPSAYAVSELAVDSITNAVAAAHRLRTQLGRSDSGDDPLRAVDRRLAALWFGFTIVPNGWELGGVWDEIAGVYPSADGYVRLHTNAPHHRRAAVTALGCTDDRDSVAATVATWRRHDVQEAIYEAGGVAVALNSRQEWLAHPQGRAVSAEPLVHRETYNPAPGGNPAPGDDPAPGHSPTARPDRPLAGVRVLDLTRVLAGPVATRFLAGLGADVIRVDPPSWDEPSVVPEVTLGKRCTRLDLARDDDRAHFVDLLASAHILVHGYRLSALDRLGFGPDERRRINPGLVDVSLNAWGHTGPWADRRGFDSIVQIASGVAHTGTGPPRPLPVQALDHATGYTMAAAAIEGWRHRLGGGGGSRWRTSLAAHAELLCAGPVGSLDAEFTPLGPSDLAESTEHTSWGLARRVRPPAGDLLSWPSGAVDLGTSARPTWLPGPGAG